jgi:hypothetical protein
MPKFRMAALFIAFALSACGGGGGGDSPPPAPPPPLAVTVTVNGAAATPSSGIFAVAPGQTVQLTSNKSVTWTPTAANVTLRSTNTAASTWSSQVINPTAQAATWSVAATAGSETATINFSLAGGDARNGDYVMFATNSQRYVLSVNFDVNEYTIVTSSGTAGQPVASGTFSADAGTINHVFNVTPPAGQANTAKFRAKASADAIVGAYPLPGTTQPVAFIAARKFATSAADFPTNVDLQFFGASGSGSPQIVQSSLFTGRFNGAVYTTCMGEAIVVVDSCPSANLAVYDLTFNANGSIRAIARPPVVDDVTFYVARIGSTWTYIRSSLNSSGEYRFRIAVPLQPTLGSTAQGADVTGSWGTLSLSPTTVTATGTGATGTATLPSGNVVNLPPSSYPPGLFIYTPDAGVKQYFVGQSSELVIINGARNPAQPTVNGYVAVGLR